MAGGQQAASNAHMIGDEPMIDYTLFNSDKSNMRSTTDRIPSTF